MQSTGAIQPQADSPAAVAMPAIVRAIAQALEPQAIVVFGSVARGTAGPNSDLDLVVVDDFIAAGRTREDSFSRAYKAIRGFRVAVDVLIFTPAEWAQWRDCEPHVIGVCAIEGRVIHGKL